MDKKNSIYLILVLAFLLFLGAFYWFAGDYQRLHRSGVLGYPPGPHSLKELYKRKYPLPAPLAEAELIQSWMTFDYINRVFSLPSDYLKGGLDITNSSYPKITIRKVADGRHALPESYLEEVKDAVRRYLILNINSAY